MALRYKSFRAPAAAHREGSPRPQQGEGNTAEDGMQRIERFVKCKLVLASSPPALHKLTWQLAPEVAKLCLLLLLSRRGQSM
jgi:hypothetical protein